MELMQFVVNTMSDTVFKGNPVAICLLIEWIPDKLMQNIAIENNLSETAFVVVRKDEYEIQWFTPEGEINLGGHSTLGAACVLMQILKKQPKTITFFSRNNPITVKKVDDFYEMEMSFYPLTAIPVTDEMEQAIGYRPLEAWIEEDLVCVMADEQQVFQAVPNEEKLKNLEGRLLHLTAKSSNYDCVVRSFAPKLNIPEVSVCGSGLKHIIPLWAEKLKKDEIIAFQPSKRNEVLNCQMRNNKVILSSKAIVFSEARIFVKI